MSDKKNADLPLLGIEEITLLEHTASEFHDAGNDIYLNPPRPVSREDLNALLLRRPEFPQISLNYQTIRALGAAEDEKARETAEEKRAETRRRSANILASFQRPFALQFSCGADGQVDFRLGIENDANGYLANCYLSAGFGYCEYVPGGPLRPRGHVWSAVCKPLRCDPNELERWPGSPANWADAVAAAVIGTDCAVRLSFVPAGREWIERHLRECVAAEDALSYYLKHKPQVTVNSGQSNIEAVNANKILSILKHKSLNTSSNATMSLALSEDYAVTDTEYELFEAQLRYRIRLLQQAGEGGWLVRLEVAAEQEDDAEAELLRALLASALLPIGFSCRWEHSAGTPGLAGAVLPAYLLPALISFPTRPFVGFRRRGCSQLELNPPNIGRPQADSLEIGSIIWDGADTGLRMQIPRREMNRHAIVFGMTGGGKTNTVCSMLSKLRDLHYLVIEPVKGEYHVLPGIQRYHMEAGTSHSLSMNPFWFPPGSKLQYHIDSLKLIISSAFDLYAAMPNILEQCLYRIYGNCGWNIVSGENIYRDELPEDLLYPTFQSLCVEIQRYLDESAFEGETAGNYRGALLSRLQSFTSGSKGLLLNTSAHIDFGRWSSENVVVELDALADDADKAIVMGALLVQYFEYIKSRGGQNDLLKHLFVLEEAHHLFRETPRNSESSASSQLVSMLNNLLAEIRAYGEGFIIVDQSPSSVSASVLKNTAVKIVHRVDYGEDIKLLQSALLLPEGDNVTASLAQGEALVRFGTMQAPAWVHIPRYPKEQTSGVYAASDPIVGGSDRICGNELLLKRLFDDSERIMNTLLIETDRRIIEQAIRHFQASARQWVSYYCGWENRETLTDGTCMDLLDLCVAHAAERTYPGQFCLQRMIRMFVQRLYGLVRNARMTDRLWAVMKDYRSVRIDTRRNFYYQNHADMVFRSMIDIAGFDADAGILKRIVDGLWVIPWNDAGKVEEACRMMMGELFYEQLSECLYAQYKLLALRYCVFASADSGPI